MTVRLPVRSEAEEQRAAIDLLQLMGYATWRVGQRNAKGTQDAGVPDVIAISESRGLLFYECKRQRGGRQSPWQKAFELACRAAGIPYVCGPVSALIEHFGASGVSRLPIEGGPIYSGKRGP